MSNIDTIRYIIGAGKPSSNLLSKANKTYDVGAQVAHERKFYSLINDPLTGKPVTNIQELNDLIVQLDQDINYRFGALLPTGSTNGGEVERILSQKYNLKLTSKTKFTSTEQARIKKILNDLADEAFQAIYGDKQVQIGLEEAAERNFLSKILFGMNAVSIKNDYMTIFMKPGLAKKSTLNRDIYDKLLVDEIPLEVFSIDIISNIVGRGRTVRRTGTELIRDKNNFIIKVKINPDLNTFSKAGFKAVYDFAEKFGLLDEKDEEEKLSGKGTLSPMDVSPEEWRQDVFNAISGALGGKYKDLLLKDASGEFGALFNKYNIGEEIALGRSISPLRGFMGELRGILIVDALIPSARGHLMGTAKIKMAEALGKEDAPVDLIVELLNEVGRPYGFQIKNTSDLSSYSWGNTRERNGMSVPGFYLERLQEALSRQETNFFGAYVYNQPASWSSDEYENVYSQFDTQFNSEFVPVYKQLALYIIRQYTQVYESDNSLLSGAVINDFFLMNNKIIPASAFYQVMNNKNDTFIDSYFTWQKPDSGYYTPENPIPGNYGNYVGQARIKYDIKVKFAQLLTSAYNIS